MNKSKTTYAWMYAKPKPISNSKCYNSEKVKKKNKKIKNKKTNKDIRISNLEKKKNKEFFLKYKETQRYNKILADKEKKKQERLFKEKLNKAKIKMSISMLDIPEDLMFVILDNLKKIENKKNIKKKLNYIFQEPNSSLHNHFLNAKYFT